MKVNRISIYFCLVVFSLLLTACSQNSQEKAPVSTLVPTVSIPTIPAVIPQSGGTTTLATPDTSVAASTLTTSMPETMGATSPATSGGVIAPSQTAAPSSNLTNTPLVKVTDQAVRDGTIRVDAVTSSGPGWVVIYTLRNGQPDQVIGTALVPEGRSTNVFVQVDPAKASEKLAVVLHKDAGKAGIFEYPGPDAPELNGLQLASTQFSVISSEKISQGAGATPTQTTVPSFKPHTPSVFVNNQPMHNEMILITEAYSVGDTWLVIHPVYADGSIGNYIGFAQLHDGENNNIRIPIDIRRTTPSLMAMLHINASKAAVPHYPGEDIPLMVNNVMIAPTFEIQGNRPGDFFITADNSGSGQPRLTDAYGMSLYKNKNDEPNKSLCIGDCLGSFRPLIITGVFTIGARDGASADKVGTIPLPNGTRQVTYDGAPLYYYLKDEKQSDVKGNGVDSAWSLVTP